MDAVYYVKTRANTYGRPSRHPNARLDNGLLSHRESP
jgi:hypothetical protein